MALLLKQKIAHRLDEESLDLTPEFASSLIASLATFGTEIDRLAYQPVRLDQVLRCSVLLSVLEFFGYEYTKQVSEATGLIMSLICGGLD